MNFDKKKWTIGLPESFKAVLPILWSEGFTPTAVGGIVRDFILSGQIGKDWDIELTHPTISFSKNIWKDLGKKLSSLGKVSFLSYDIIRLEIGTFQFEFSPPRKEIFSSGWQEEGHSNFEVDFDFKLPFAEAVLRRDFTINAMGIRALADDNFEFLDPLNGLQHLQEKNLHPAGADFNKDPVRFLRAIRFAQKFHLNMSSELKKILQQMKVGHLSASYLWSEMQKSKDPISFYQNLLEEKKRHLELHLPLEANSQVLNDLKKINLDPQEHESWIMAWEWIGIDSTPWQKFFSLSAESSRRLGRWAQSSRDFQKILPEIFHGEFEDIRIKKEFELLFDWYFTTKQLMQKNPNLPIVGMIEKYLPDWIHLYRFEVVKDVKHINPPLRAKYQVWNLCQRL